MDDDIKRKVLRDIETGIERIISNLPPEAKKKDKIAAICRGHRLNRNIARLFI